ncbi:MAG: hypothetical protein RMK52_07140 [Chitinophagales bacterium]|nr:hypothetical protein [Chitinophagales bacterium]MDW8394005.1 hypothetical protein [Chitinophagales bacterium]
MLEQLPSLSSSVASAVVLSCKPNLTDLLAGELKSMGFSAQVISPTAVRTSATFRDAIRICLSVRTANFVRWELAVFPANDLNTLYARLVRLPWEQLIPTTGYFSVASWSDMPQIRNSMFLNQRVKDAVVDRFREKKMPRPDSGSEKKAVVLYVHWHKSQAGIYVDLAGSSLHRRGYRLSAGQAPMEETLAAAMVLASGWSVDEPLIVPLCGSGTLAIEAALLATGTAPGLLHDRYSFRHLCGFNEDIYQEIKNNLIQKKVTVRPVIVASDADSAVLSRARENARRAGIGEHITFYHCPFEQTPLPKGKPGVMLLNPPYGIRQGDRRELIRLYASIGSYLRHQAADYRVLLLTAAQDLIPHLGLRPAARRQVFNGALPCALLEFKPRSQ